MIASLASDLESVTPLDLQIGWRVLWLWGNDLLPEVHGCPREGLLHIPRHWVKRHDFPRPFVPGHVEVHVFPSKSCRLAPVCMR